MTTDDAWTLLNACAAPQRPDGEAYLDGYDALEPGDARREQMADAAATLVMDGTESERQQGIQYLGKMQMRDSTINALAGWYATQTTAIPALEQVFGILPPPAYSTLRDLFVQSPEAHSKIASALVATRAEDPEVWRAVFNTVRGSEKPEVLAELFLVAFMRNRRTDFATAALGRPRALLRAAAAHSLEKDFLDTVGL